MASRTSRCNLRLTTCRHSCPHMCWSECVCYCIWTPSNTSHIWIFVLRASSGSKNWSYLKEHIPPSSWDSHSFAQSRQSYTCYKTSYRNGSITVHLQQCCCIVGRLKSSWRTLLIQLGLSWWLCCHLFLPFLALASQQGYIWFLCYWTLFQESSALLIPQSYLGRFDFGSLQKLND